MSNQNALRILNVDLEMAAEKSAGCGDDRDGTSGHK